jgi:hypothetical protein
VRDEHRQVLAPLAHRRKRQLDDRESVVEILPESACSDLVPEPAVRCRDDPDVDGLRVVGTDPADFASLEHTKELRLEIERELADLVEEDRPAVGDLEHAGARLDRTRERTLLVTEELALDEARGRSTAVEHDEGTARAERSLVHGAARELLSGSRSLP